MRTETIDYPIGNQEAESASQIIQVESNRLVPTLIALTFISVIFGIVGFCFGLMAMDKAKAAKTEAEIATMRTEGFTRALIAKRIDPYPHIEGEPP